MPRRAAAHQRRAADAPARNRTAASRTGSLGSTSCDVCASCRKRECMCRGRIVKSIVAFEARNRGRAFHLSRPPHDHGGILLGERLYRFRRRLGQHQWDNRGRVPELHRLIALRGVHGRPSTFFNGGDLLAKRFLGAGRRAGRTMPSRTRRDSRLSSSERSALTSSSRTTGRPRSTISTGEPPPLTLSINALRLFLASGDTGLVHNGQNSLIEMALQTVDSNGQSVSVVSQGF
jgi:hypothetical protein